ncbi:hypothetical protein N9I19_08305 [Peribacillus sp. CSMR9]|nr:hypothetical protein [Peribacillus sp. CSMR9]
MNLTVCYYFADITLQNILTADYVEDSEINQRILQFKLPNAPSDSSSGLDLCYPFEWPL